MPATGKIRLRRRMSRRLLLLFCLAVAAGGAPAHAASVVPEGNRNLEQPPVPGASAARTRALRTSYDAKYRKVYALLEGDHRLRKKIVEAAAAYGIDPVHIAGAIIGEHTYNVDAYDRIQSYYVKAVSYVTASFPFSFEGSRGVPSAATSRRSSASSAASATDPTPRAERESMSRRERMGDIAVTPPS